MNTPYYDEPDVAALSEVMAEVQQLLQAAQDVNARIESAQLVQQNCLNRLTALVAQLAKRIESDDRLAKRSVSIDRTLATPQSIRAACIEALRRKQKPMTTPDLYTALNHVSVHVGTVKDVYNALSTDDRFRRVGQGRLGKWSLAEA